MEGKVSNTAQIAYVRRYTLTEGRETGLKIIEVENGRLRFLLNESRALDIAQLWHGGKNVSFISKIGMNSDESSFLNRFEGGMLYTCGLESVGGREGYELHGTLHLTPARVTKAECTQQGITIEAEMLCAQLFGKELVLKRRIFTALGSDTLEITDTLENRAYRDEQYCLLYHVNLGYPMLDEGAEIVAEEKKVYPRTEWAQAHLGELKRISAPVPNQFEMCYFVEMNKPRASLVNKKLGKAFTLDWSQDTLPQFILWKSMAHGDYALGFEPATTKLDGDFAYSCVKAQSSVSFSLKLSVNDL